MGSATSGVLGCRDGQQGRAWRTCQWRAQQHALLEAWRLPSIVASIRRMQPQHTSIASSETLPISPQFGDRESMNNGGRLCGV